MPQPLTPEELKARPTDAGQADEDEEDPWAALDPNEHEGPSAPPAPTAKAEASPKAASTGVPLPENEPSGTVYPKNSKGQVEKYRYMLDEDIGGKVVEHVVVDSHPYELMAKTCWEMEGADTIEISPKVV